MFQSNDENFEIDEEFLTFGKRNQDDRASNSSSLSLSQTETILQATQSKTNCPPKQRYGTSIFCTDDFDEEDLELLTQSSVAPFTSANQPIASSTQKSPKFNFKPQSAHKIHSEKSSAKRVCPDTETSTSKKIRTFEESRPNFPRKDVTSLLKLVNVSQNENSKFSPGSSNATNTFFRNDTTRTHKRKFPGPAGLLPEVQTANTSTTEKPYRVIAIEKPRYNDVCSQETANQFQQEAWQKMLRDYSSAADSLPRNYTIAWLKTRANLKQLVNYKSPFLAAMIHSISHNSKIILLKDETDTIHGFLEKEVWEQYNNVLQPGSVLVLRQPSILSLPIKRHYVNVTVNNVVVIYSEEALHRGPRFMNFAEFQSDIELRNGPNEKNSLNRGAANPQPRNKENVHVSTPGVQNTSRYTNKAGGGTWINQNFSSTPRFHANRNNVSTEPSVHSEPNNSELESIVNSTLQGIDVDSLFGDF